MRHALFIACIGLCGCSETILGLTPRQRFGLYGAALAATGHPELAGPAAVIGNALDKRPRNVILADTVPAFLGLPLAGLMMAGFVVAVGAIFYLINQMKP